MDVIVTGRNSIEQGIVCQCEGGVSRSPAVAAAICRSTGGDDARFFRQYQPNRYVYRLLGRCLGEPPVSCRAASE